MLVLAMDIGSPLPTTSKRPTPSVPLARSTAAVTPSRPVSRPSLEESRPEPSSSSPASSSSEFASSSSPSLWWVVCWGPSSAERTPVLQRRSFPPHVKVIAPYLFFCILFRVWVKSSCVGVLLFLLQSFSLCFVQGSRFITLLCPILKAHRFKWVLFVRCVSNRSRTKFYILTPKSISISRLSCFS